MAKYFIEKKGKGKFSYFAPIKVSGKELKECENEGVELFDSKQEAYEEIKRKKNY